MRSTQAKVCISVAIVLAGLVLTVALVSTASPNDFNSGILIDFGDRDVVYTAVDEDEDPDPLSALEYACSVNGLDLSMDKGGISIGGVADTDEARWSLYGVPPGSTSWTALGEDADSYSLSDFTILCWGYCGDDEEPTRAVDSTGVCFYGYSVPTRVVSLAPSCTETLCAVGGLDSLVGTDMYSNYPQGVVDAQEDGTIAIVGGFTNPSYEMVLLQSPDMVVCIGNQSSHVSIAEKLRAYGVDVLVLDGGESIDAVLDNVYMASVVLGEVGLGAEVLDSIDAGITTVEGILDADDVEERRVMVALSAVQSPWVSGSDTYIQDVVTLIRAENIYESESGWVQVNAETIAQYDPEVIIVVSDDYGATQSDYEAMMASLSAEWRLTTAYQEGEIYLLTGDATDLASRPGPRVAQITELMARIVHPDAFDDGVTLPKYVGDDYERYLTITKGEGARWHHRGRRS